MRRSKLPVPDAYWQLTSGPRAVRLGIDVDASEFVALEFRANDSLLWSVDLQGEGSRAARIRAHSEMRSQAKQLNVADFDGLVRSLATSLHCIPDQARALAIVFVFPGPYAVERAGARWDEPKKRGRPTSVERALRIQKLVLAWIALTGTRAGISHSRFLAAFAAAAPFLGLHSMRGQFLRDAEKFLRQEQKKLRSAHFKPMRPPLQGETGDLQLTTP